MTSWSAICTCALGLVVLAVPLLEATAQESITRIFSLAWSPDGTTLAIGGIFENQRAVRLVNQEGSIVHQFDVPSGTGGVSWRPDGAQIAAGGSRVWIWDARTGEAVLSFDRLGAAANYSTFWNPANLDEIAYAEQDRVTIRNVITGQILLSLDGEGGRPDAVLGIGWSQDGTALYTVSEDDVIRVWDTSTGMVNDVFPLTYGAGTFAMSPDASQLAIGSTNSVYIHSAIDGHVVAVLESLPEDPPTAGIAHLLWRPDGKQLAGVDRQGIHIWDVETGHLIETIPHLAENWVAAAVAYRPDGALTYPGAAQHIRATSIEDVLPASVELTPESLPNFGGVVWHPTEDQIACFASDTITVYSGDLQVLSRWRIPSEDAQATSIRITEVAWSPDGSRLAATIFRAEDDRGLERIVIWDVRANSATVTFDVDDHTPPLAWSPDSRYIAAVSLFDPGQIDVYDTLAENLVGRLVVETNVSTLDWHPQDSHRLAIGLLAPTRSTVIVDPLAPEGLVLAELPATGGRLGVGFSPDGTYYTTSGPTLDEIQVWAASEGPSPTAPVYSFPYVLGSRAVLSAAWVTDGLVVVYSEGITRKFAVDGQVVASVPFQAGTSMVAWRPDGRKLVTYSRAAGMRMLDGRSGDVLAGIRPDGSRLTAPGR